MTKIIETWLDRVYKSLHEPHDGETWQMKVSQNSHLNRQRLNNATHGRGTIATLIRILVNWAMMFTTQDEFLREWKQLGIDLYNFADKHGDEFNLSFSKDERRKNYPEGISNL